MLEEIIFFKSIKKDFSRYNILKNYIFTLNLDTDHLTLIFYFNIVNLRFYNSKTSKFFYKICQYMLSKLIIFALIKSTRKKSILNYTK